MGSLKVNGNIDAAGKLFATSTGARITTSNKTQSIWFGINEAGTAWGVYNDTTAGYIFKQTESSTQFYGNATTASAAPWAGITGKPDNYPVRQSRTAATNYRPLLMHLTNSGYGEDPGAVNGQVYYNETIAACPSKGIIKATTFAGALTGNADTATSLLTPRTLTIGSTGKTFNGTANVSWSLTEIGAAAASHTHSYLPLSGGTITGSVTFSKSNNYYDMATGTGGSILLNNGDIGGVNSIYFKDAANTVGEGLLFYRSATKVDSLRAYNGVLYFSPNYDPAAGTQDGTYTVVHSGNYTSYQTDNKVQQSRSTSSSWRALLSHYTATSQGTDPAAATNIAYYNEKASIQPSTGKIYSAGGFIGNATTATTAGGINSISPVLATAGESNVLQAINNYDYYTNDTPIKHSLLGMIKALDFQWYTSHWRIGNLRSGSTASSGFGFAFSANNSTWNLRAFIGIDGFLWANKLGSYNYGSSLPSSGQKGEIFFKI